jgi:hypothetical protein
MATVIDALLITFGLDPSGIHKGAEEGKSSLEGLKSAALKAFAVIGSAVLIKQAFSEYLVAADSVAKLSAKLGENASEMQAWGGAVALEGGSIESFNSSISNLNEGLVQMATTGGGRSAKFFQALGISATDASGKVKPATEVLLELSDKFKDMSAQEVAGLGAKMGLDAGTISMLKKGRDGIAAMIEEQKELGEYTKKDTDAAEAFNDSWDKTSKSLSMVATKIFTIFTPALTGMMDAIRPIIIQIRKWAEILSDKLQPAIDAITKFMKEHQTVVTTAFAVIAGVLVALLVPALWSAVVATYALLAPYIAIAAVIALVGLAIGLLVEDFIVWQEGGESAFGGVYQAVADFWAQVKPIVDLFINYFTAGWALIWEAAKTAFAFLKGLFTGNFTEFFAAIDGLQEKFALFWEAVKNLAAPFFDWLGEKFATVAELGGKVAGFFSFGGDDEGSEAGASGASGAGAPTAKDAVSPAAVAAGASAGSKTVTVTQSVGSVTVNTQATDGKGVASALNGATNNELQGLVNSVDSGVMQ